MRRQNRRSVWKFRRGDRPYWYIRFFDDKGKLRSESTRTTDEEKAEIRRQDKESDLNHGRYKAPDETRWDEFLNAYEEEELPRLAANSQTKRLQVLGMFEEITEPKRMSDVTQRRISLFAAHRQAAGRSLATVKADLAHLRSAFGWAAEQGMLNELPRFPAIKIPKGTNRARIRLAAKLTTEYYERLIMKAPSKSWVLLIAFAWHCGLRRTEALNVRGEDVDLDEHTIAIPGNKAGDEAATVFITPELDASLRQHFPEGVPTRGPLIDQSEFPGDVRQVSKRFTVIARRAGVRGNGKVSACGCEGNKCDRCGGAGTLGGWAVLHDLRRSFGSRWAAKVPAQVLQRMMRHAHIKTTMEYYADVDQAALSLLWPDCTRECTRSQKSNAKEGAEKA